MLSVWLAFILSEANHRMSHVESPGHRRAYERSPPAWIVPRRLEHSTSAMIGWPPYSITSLSEDAAWQEFERRLNQHMLRVYDLRPQRVRVDATTAKYYGRINDDLLLEGLFGFGHSKDRRPDLAQLKINLAVLDPLGVPLSTTRW